MTKKDFKTKILNLVEEYYKLYHSNNVTKLTPINYAGRVYDEKELKNLVDAALDFWLTSGPYTDLFEKKLANILGLKYSIFVNSGSSANLLAFMTLTSDKLGNRRIKRGDEIITVACCFPTTLSPIVQFGAIPVFIDIDLPSYNIKTSLLQKALTPKTKAIFLAHTLGNPVNLQVIKSFCDKNNLWFIEDNCDALGSKYFYKNRWRYTGAFGDIAASSFYPPHHITTGEGGAVYTNNHKLYKIALSLRDWGRDCWCPSGTDNSCKKRFNWQLGELPYGYDHKYTYSTFGYNLKATDLQAAIGLSQLDKLDCFIEKRRQNWKYLRAKLSKFEDKFFLPEEEKHSLPSWFGFTLTVKENAGFSRNEIVKYLENNGIQTRMLFAGNIIKHPCFDEMRKNKKGYRIIGDLKNTDFVMNNTFWIGVYPGLSKKHLDYVVKTFEKFFSNTGKKN